jgi:hypothetical protein
VVEGVIKRGPELQALGVANLDQLRERRLPVALAPAWKIAKAYIPEASSAFLPPQPSAVKST